MLNKAFNCGILQSYIQNKSIKSKSETDSLKKDNFMKNLLFGFNFDIELQSDTRETYNPKMFSPQYIDKNPNRSSTQELWKQQFYLNVGESDIFDPYTYAYGEELGGDGVLTSVTNPKLVKLSSPEFINSFYLYKDIVENLYYDYTDGVWKNGLRKNYDNLLSSIGNIPIPQYVITIYEPGHCYGSGQDIYQKISGISNPECYRKKKLNQDIPMEHTRDSGKYRLFTFVNNSEISLLLYMKQPNNFNGTYYSKNSGEWPVDTAGETKSLKWRNNLCQ